MLYLLCSKTHLNMLNRQIKNNSVIYTLFFLHLFSYAQHNRNNTTYAVTILTFKNLNKQLGKVC